MLIALRFGRLWLLLAGLLLTVAACKKKDDSQPQPATPTGSFDATFKPAGSIQYVTLGAQGNGSSQVASGQPDATGYMKVDNLTPGNYVLTFHVADSYYVAPAPQALTITANTNTALGTIRVDPAIPPNTYVPLPVQGTSGWVSTISSAGIGTTATQASTSGSVTFYNGNPSALTLKGIYQSGSLSETVELHVPGVGSNPAQYQLDYANGGGYGTYLRTEGGATSYTLDSEVSGIQGTVTVTAFNTSTRTITGTFGFNMYGNQGHTQGTVTNGTFSVTY